MAFSIQHQSLLLGQASSGFSKNYFYEWEDGLGGAPVQLFLSLSLEDATLPGEELGTLMFEVMKNHFFSDLDRASSIRFEETLKEVNHVISNKASELEADLVSKFHVIVAVISDDQLYLAQRGEAEAYLVRRRFVSAISDSLSSPAQSEDLFSNIAQGSLNESDVILFSSRRLLRYVTKSDLAKLFADHALKVSLEKLESTISLDLMESTQLLAIEVGPELAPTLIQGDEQDSTAPSSRKEQLFSRLTPLKARLDALVLRRSERQEASSKSESMGSLGSEFLEEWKRLKRDRILMILIGVVLVLLVGIYVVRNQGQKQQLIEELEAQLEQVEINVKTAQTTGSYDRTAASALLDEAEAWALEVLNSGYLRSKANEYLLAIETQRDQLNNVNRIESPEVFLDFSTVDPQMNALGIVTLGDRLYVYEYDTLYEVILDEIQAPISIDPDEVVVDAEILEDRESIVFLTKSNRVLEYVAGQVNFLDNEDGAWRSAVDLEIYNDRLYFLDPSENQIWRYFPQRSGYSSADPYVTQEDFDLSQAVSFAIDGSVFVLNDDGTMNNLVSGEDADLRVNQPPGGDVSGATLIDTEFEQFNVFILEPSMNRVLIYSKDSNTGNLVYSRQFVLEGVEDLRDLYVDKEANRMYLVGKTKVYEIGY